LRRYPASFRLFLLCQTLVLLLARFGLSSLDRAVGVSTFGGDFPLEVGDKIFTAKGGYFTNLQGNTILKNEANAAGPRIVAKRAVLGAAIGLPGAAMEASARFMDKLTRIFEMQEELNARIGVNLKGIDEKEQTKWVLNYTRAMQQEMAELTDSVPWKWWAKYQEFDKQNARVEIVDLFHFLVSLAQTLGMTADDVFDAYVAKNKVNHQRQDSGYTEKDEADSRHI